MEEYGYNDLSQKWKEILKCESVFTSLLQGKEEIFTPGINTFRCFKYCEPEDIKIIIIGQDPYVESNDGLAFSSSKYKVAICTILNCLKRKGKLVYDKNYAELDPWAERGVLLLNAMLTTPKKNNKDKALHNFWLTYTKNVINYFADKNVVFFVWGKFAEGITTGVPSEKKYVYHHPTAKRGVWDFNGFDKVDFDWSL
jgi:uracil-DNA glycosylase